MLERTQKRRARRERRRRRNEGLRASTTRLTRRRDQPGNVESGLRVPVGMLQSLSRMVNIVCTNRVPRVWRRCSVKLKRILRLSAARPRQYRLSIRAAARKIWDWLCGAIRDLLGARRLFHMEPLERRVFLAGHVPTVDPSDFLSMLSVVNVPLIASGPLYGSAFGKSPIAAAPGELPDSMSGALASEGFMMGLTGGGAPVATDDSYTTLEDAPLVVGPTTSNLENWWKFNEGGTNQSLTDSGLLGNSARRGSTAGVDADDPAWVAGYVGSNALSFDGTDDYVATTSTVAQTNNNFTLSAWFQTDTAIGAHHLLWEGYSGGRGFGHPNNNSSSAEMNLSVGTYNQDNKIVFFLGYDTPSGSADPIYIVSGSNFTETTQWHNAVVTVSDAGGGVLSASLYVDGILEGTDTGTQNDRSQWSGPMQIGKPSAAQRYFDGKIDEVRVYNTALGVAQVQDIARSGVLGNDTAPGALVHVDPASVTGPSHGTLSINGDGSFIYTPTANYSGTDTFTYQASDGTTNSNTATVTIDVTAVNDAPTLDNTKSPALAAQNEDCGAPSGVVGMLVSNLVDFASPAGQVDNVIDPDSGALLGIAVTAADTSNGSWWYSTDGGTSWNALGAVADNNARLLAADANTRIFFQPNADYNGTLASAITFRAWDQTSGSNGSLADTTTNGGSTAFSGATDTASLAITAVNDAPVNTAPSSQTIVRGGSLAFSMAGNNAITVSDIDAGTSALQMTLSASSGTLTLGGTSGLAFSVGDGNADATMTFTGTLAAINAALEGLTFTPPAGYTGTVTIQITTNDQGNTGSGGAQSDTDPIVVNVIPPASAALWLSSISNATASGGVSWTDGEAVRFGDPNLAFEPGTTSGTFSSLFNIDNFAGDGKADLSALYRVYSDITVGGGAHSVALEVGDVLLSITGSETLGGVAVTDQDLVLFRPASPNNFTSGTFSILLNSPTGDKIRDVSLVETPVTVGGVALNPGDFLLVQSSGTYDKDVWRLVPTSVGNGTTAGAFTELINGATISMDQLIGGMELVQHTVTLGTATLQAGQILMNVRTDDSAVGSNGIEVKMYDVFVLDVTQAGAITTANATLLFQGADVGINAGGEQFDGIALVVTNYAPVLSGANNPAAINEDPATNPGTLVSALIAGKVVDYDSGALSGIAVTGVDNTNGTWQFSTNSGATWTDFGAPSNAAARLLASDAGTLVRFVPNANWNGSATLTFRAWDQTSGSSGGQADTTTNGGVSAFSAATATATLTVNAVDDAPVITSNGGGATAAVSIAENTTAVTTVTSTDIDGGTPVYSIAGGADAARFQINSSTGALTFASAPDFESPADANANNVYDVIVQVSDGAGGTDTQAITVTVAPVNDNNPIITSDGGGATAAVSVAENGTAVTTITATDADLPAQMLTYSIVGGADAGRFAIDSSTGALTFQVAPNYESPVDVGTDNVYNVTVQASDGAGGTDTQAIAVTVTDVDEFDVSPISDANAAPNTVPENSAIGTVVGITVAASDADGTNNTITYSLDDDAGGRFAVDSATGVITVNAAMDYESATSHTIQVRATSADGSSSTRSFTIAVSDVNEFAISAISDADPGADAVNENVPNGTLVGITALATDADGTDTVSYSLDDDAGGRFAIDPVTGAVSVSGAIDREAAASYNIIVRATSTDGSNSTRTFAISIGDVDEFDTSAISDSDASADAVDENVANGTTVGITAYASDADATTNAITYSLDDDAGGRFAIDPATGVVTVADGSLLDREAAASHSITVRATSADTSSSTRTFTIAVNPLNDNSPIITSDGGGATAAVNVAENNTAVTTVTATDADLPPDTLMYSIVGGADAARFSIDGSTGALSFSAAPDFESPADANADNAYDVIVQASDGVGGTDTQAITVNVTPVNDNNPVITSDGGGASASVSVAENSTVVTTVTATDADLPAQTLSYSISGGADATLFSVDSSTGALSFKSAPDREAPTDANSDNVYDVTVQVSDGAGRTDAQAISVTVSDVDEFDTTPISDVDAAADAVDENAANDTPVGINALASDADATNNAITYSLDDSAGGRFAIDPVTGAVTVADGTLLDRESASSHDITIRATSADGSFSTRSFTISIGDVNEFATSAVVDDDPAGDAVAENAANGMTVGIAAFANDPDATNNTIAYSLDSDAGGRFAIDSATGIVTVSGAIDYEAATSHSIIIRATSSDGSFSTRTFAIDVLPVNDNTPAITSDGAGDAASVNVDENTTGVTTVTAIDADLPAETLTYSIIGGDDAARFQIDSATGDMTFRVAPDYESPADANADNVYEVIVRVSDGLRNDTQALSVTVNDRNEFAVSAVQDANDSVNAVDENAANGTAVGITASAIDADGTTNTISYSLDDDAGGRFTIDPATGVVTVADGTLLDREAAASHDITIRATSADGSSSTSTFTIDVNALNDNTPQITSDGAGPDAAVHVLENTTPATTVTATDADLPAEALTYSIAGGADAAFFAIDPSTGNLSFKSPPDYEAPADANRDNIYEVTVRVSDGVNSDTQALSVYVDDSNEPPIVLDREFEVKNTAPAGTVVGTIRFHDPEGDSVQFVIEGEAGPFQLDGTTGILTVANSEELARYAGQDVVLQVRVSDRGHPEVFVIVPVRITVVQSGGQIVPPQPVIPVPTGGGDIAPPVDGGGKTDFNSNQSGGSGGKSDSTVTPVPAGNSSESTEGNNSDKSPSTPDPVPDPTPSIPTPTPAQPVVNAPAAKIDEKRQAFDDLGSISPVTIAPINKTQQFQPIDATGNAPEEGPAKLKLRVGLTSALGCGMAGAYLLWMIRGGTLIASFLSSVPLWRLIDPLFVLPQHRPDRNKRRRRKEGAEAPEERFFHS